MPLSLRRVLRHPEHPPGYATDHCCCGRLNHSVIGLLAQCSVSSVYSHQLFNVANWKAGGPGSRNHVKFMYGWSHDLNNMDLTFVIDCLISSSSLSQLSVGISLEKVYALYAETVSYLKVNVTHMTSSLRPSFCNIEKLGWVWVRG